MTKKRFLTTISSILLISTSSQLYIVADLWAESQKKSQPPKIYINYLKKGSIIMKRLAARKLGDYNDRKSIRSLIQATNYKDYKVRYLATKSLVKQGKVALPFLIQSLKHQNLFIRESSAKVLGEIKDKKAVSALLFSTKKDKSYRVRLSSVEALGKIGDRKAIPTLIQALRDNNWQVRSTAAKALGIIKDNRSILPLIELLKDKNSYVRINSAESLGRLKNRKAIPVLIKLLQDNDSDVRETAAWSLGKIKDRRAVKALFHSLIKDRNGSVRKEARESLKRMGYSSKQIDQIKKR